MKHRKKWENKTAVTHHVCSLLTLFFPVFSFDSLKISGNQGFSDVFRGEQKRLSGRKGLINKVLGVFHRMTFQFK